jgi:RIO kinase 1
MPRPEEIFFPTRRERTEDRRKEGQQRKLLDEFFDHATLLSISRLINRKVILSVESPVSTGKEGGVFLARTAQGFAAVKVYRIGNTVFRHLPAYALEELRREASERNFARLIYAWTRREHTILSRLEAAHVRAPLPIAYFRNVLVMSFVGEGGISAPRLQQAAMSDPAPVYADLTAQLRRMAVEAHLVHGDLSPYNVLLDRGAPVLIDLGQAIDWAHPQARELLLRDAKNFARFFTRLGVATSTEEFFAATGGLELPKPEGR